MRISTPQASLLLPWAPTGPCTACRRKLWPLRSPAPRTTHSAAAYQAAQEKVAAAARKGGGNGWTWLRTPGRTGQQAVGVSVQNYDDCDVRSGSTKGAESGCFGRPVHADLRSGPTKVPRGGENRPASGARKCTFADHRSEPADQGDAAFWRQTGRRRFQHRLPAVVDPERTSRCGKAPKTGESAPFVGPERKKRYRTRPEA